MTAYDVSSVALLFVSMYCQIFSGLFFMLLYEHVVSFCFIKSIVHPCNYLTLLPWYSLITQLPILVLFILAAVLQLLNAGDVSGWEVSHIRDLS